MHEIALSALAADHENGPVVGVMRFGLVDLVRVSPHHWCP